MIDDEVRREARVLWRYHFLETGLDRSDFALALGSHDERVAEAAARVVLDDLVPLLVCSGGFGKVTRTTATISEGERFAQIAMELGVPRSKIIIENEAANTGANIVNTRELLRQRGISVNTGILVTKPYMRRRAYAAATKQWPTIEWLVTSPELSYDNYADNDEAEERMIELMVGDLQRIQLYAESGFQTPQDIPQNIWESYEKLVARGFDKFVLRPDKRA